MGTPRGPRGDLAQRVELLTPEERRALGVLAVVARGSLSVEEVARLAEVTPSIQVLTDLERQALARREPDGRWSLAPESVSQLKRLLAEIDTTDRVLRGFIGIAEDGRLTPQDLDAVVELTRIAAETGRWPELLQLAEAAETTLSTTHRVEAWEEIVERRLEASRVVGDTPATVRAERELARLAARSEPVLAGTGHVVDASSAGSAPPAGTRWVLVAVAVVVVAIAALGVGYLLGDNGSGEGAAAPASPNQTVTDTVTQEVTGPTETVTEVQTETLTETVTETVTVTETQSPIG